MIELIEANWWLFAIALLIGIAVAWLIFKGTRRTKVAADTEVRGGDVLDADAAPAARNQALIDAVPKAAAPVVPPVAMSGLAGGETIAEAAMQEARLNAVAPATVGKDSSADDLTRLKGVGPKLCARLNELGVVSFAQVAAWSDEDVARIDAQLGRFAGRIQRDDWRTQAMLLDTGDTAAYTRKFGNL